MRSYWKLGCRWGSKNEGKPLFFDLLLREKIVISWVDKDFGNGNYVLLTDGFIPLGIAITKSDRKTIIEKEALKDEFLLKQIDFSRDLYYYEADIYQLLDADFTFDYQKGISRIWSNKIHSDINRNLNDLLNSGKMNNIIGLLKYKKQIILQGPPGTGKTRLAKEIARELLIEDLKNSFSEVDLLAIVKEKTIIYTFTNYNSFEIVKVDSNSFIIYPKGAKLEYKVFFSDVIDCIKDFDANDLVKKYDKKGVGTYLVGIAKYVVDSLETVRQQIIQFHSSYTYEDFVRGIMVKPNPDGDGVLYEAENKILGAFANQAFQNYKLSRKQVSVSVSDIELFDLFINDIKEKIADSDEQRFSLTDAVYLFEPDEKRFKYKGDNWIAHSKGLNMKFSELQKIIASNVTERAQVNQLDGVEELTKQHATYFIKVVEMFYQFKSNHSSNQTNKEIKTALKNYVLIVDEINRANLSSVLGELIYALEYRGESVDSMYAIDGNNKLILPPNLFIVGTMNTADRSVGHIDYAIRRRFAFVDVLPEILEINDFDKDLFTTVAKLFVKEWDNQWESSSYLSPEFAPKDVMLGHSYFIKQYEKDDSGNNINDKPYDFKMRVKYEIVPILREYVKDGILNEKACDEIDRIENAYPI